MRQTGSGKYEVQPSNLEEEYERDDIHDLEVVEGRDDVLSEELNAKNFKMYVSTSTQRVHCKELPPPRAPRSA